MIANDRAQLLLLSALAVRLATRATTLHDEDTTQLAIQIAGIAAGLVKNEESENGPLPELSERTAGLYVPLEHLDTTANRRYLSALTEAWQAARAVDQERGYGEDGPAQDLEDLVAKTRLEIYGPAGSRFE